MSLRSALYLLPLFVLAACESRDKPTTEATTTTVSAADAAPYREELLSFAIDNLNRLEEFGSTEVVQQILQRLQSEDSSQTGLFASWPEPEMLRQVIDRLNQWIQSQSPLPEWSVDPLLKTVPKEYQELPAVKELPDMRFSRFEGYSLQEAAWLRDITAWAKGDLLDDVERAKNLFDWTVRNIQIEAADMTRAPQLPWETLLFGRGTASERAWVFILLLRQLDIDAAVLAVDTTASSSSATNSPDAKPAQRPWCVGVLIDNDVYLFDPLLGLPIPGPNGVTVNDKGQLAIHPATLSQLVADDKLLRRLDVDESHPYRVKSSDLKHVTAMIEASPQYLAQSMKVLESKLAGSRKMILATSPTKQSQRWKAAKQIGAAALWLHPYETLYRREQLDLRQTKTQLAAMLPFYVLPSAPLYRGRVLQLKGKFLGEDGAMQYYQAARPSHEELAASSIAGEEKLMRWLGKQDASYWSGLMAYQRGNYAAAVDYFMKRTLEAYPNGRWTTGALYNLARSYEASGQKERAVLQYGSNAASPSYSGDLLRAKWLQEQPKPNSAESPKGATP